MLLNALILLVPGSSTLLLVCEKLPQITLSCFREIWQEA
jgi:hypothetical protein